ncbi:MAG: hypothetical protein WBV36_05385 [Terriglobales bacterium]
MEFADLAIRYPFAKDELIVKVSLLISCLLCCAFMNPQGGLDQAGIDSKNIFSYRFPR